MNKFKPVLTDDELTKITRIAYVCDYENWLARKVEQAVLAKLAEQEPVIYLYESDLYAADDMGINDHIREHGTPLYTHPCASPTSHKHDCVSESRESYTQRHLDYIKRYQKWRRGEDKTMDEAGLTPKQIGEALDWLIGVAEDHIADASKKVPEGWQLVPIEPTYDMTENAHNCDSYFEVRDIYKAMLEAAPKYTGEK